MSVRYEVRGNLSELSIRPAVEPPGRRDRLWEDTCLELFLGTADCGGYWEFNLSPAGHWNAYRFTGYRGEMREEAAFTSLPLAVRIGRNALELSIELPVGKIIRAEGTIQAGVAAVVKTVNGGTSHWAQTHPGPRPDFHRRENFALEFPPKAG